MPNAFHVFVTNHPIDGVKLALRQKTPGINPDQRLILVTGGGVNTALSFGYVLPAEYTGLGGLLRYPAKALAVEVEDDEHTAQVVFPSPASGHLDDYAELLDRLRGEFDDWKQVTLIIEYNRVHADLPPLGKADKVTCCWEARDLLTSGIAEALEYVGDRVEEDGASFEGLQLYTRVAGLRARAEARKQTLTGETKLPFLPAILELEPSAEEEPPAPVPVPATPPTPAAKPDTGEETAAANKPAPMPPPEPKQEAPATTTPPSPVPPPTPTIPPASSGGGAPPPLPSANAPGPSTVTPSNPPILPPKK